MEVTHSKGLMYPALQLSSFRVRRDSLPPAFELPPEIGQATSQPLPEVRSVVLEKKVLQETQRLLEEEEKERNKVDAAIAKEEEAKEQERKRLKEAKAREAGGNEEVVRRVTDMGFTEEQARRALAANKWDGTAAINELLSSG